jgi:hypothetical protein
MIELGTWEEPDPSVLKTLTQFGCFAADLAMVRSNPSTRAEETEIAVESTLRALLANGFIQATIPENEVCFIPHRPKTLNE